MDFTSSSFIALSLAFASSMALSRAVFTSSIFLSAAAMDSFNSSDGDWIFFIYSLSSSLVFWRFSIVALMAVICSVTVVILSPRSLIEMS